MSSVVVEFKMAEISTESNTKIESKAECVNPDEKSPVKTNGHEPSLVGEEKHEEVQESLAEEKSCSEGNEPESNKDEEAEKSVNTEEAKPDDTKEEDRPVAEKKEDDLETKKTEALGSTVAKHYNEIPAGTKETRKDSRIFYLRNFNNWCKSVVINEYLEKVKRRKRTSDEINILDLACGKGGDLLKWDKGKVDHVIMADIAATSIEQCKERYNKLERDHKSKRYTRDPLFTTEFLAIDCTKEQISEKYKKKEIKLDLTSCQFAFHYSFESYEQCDQMLKNACSNLRVGGYFVGTTLNADKLVKRLKSAEGNSFGNSVFNINCENKETFPLFGAKYMFHLEGVVDCPEFLVHMPTLEKLAAKYNMVLKWKKTFHELYEENKRNYDTLLSRMNALEKYPASGDKQLCGGDDQYAVAKEYMSKRTSVKMVGTMSSDEWEAAGLYLAFAFEKTEPPRESRPSERDDRKRRRDKSGDSHRSSRSRDGSRHDKREKSSDSATAKKTKKDSECEDVYEVKDEIEGDDDIETTKDDDVKTDADAVEEKVTSSETTIEKEAEVTESMTTEEPATEKDTSENDDKTDQGTMETDEVSESTEAVAAE